MNVPGIGQTRGLTGPCVHSRLVTQECQEMRCGLLTRVFRASQEAGGVLPALHELARAEVQRPARSVRGGPGLPEGLHLPNTRPSPRRGRFAEVTRRPWPQERRQQTGARAAVARPQELTCHVLLVRGWGQPGPSLHSGHPGKGQQRRGAVWRRQRQDGPRGQVWGSNGRPEAPAGLGEERRTGRERRS